MLNINRISTQQKKKKNHSLVLTPKIFSDKGNEERSNWATGIYWKGYKRRKQNQATDYPLIIFSYKYMRWVDHLFKSANYPYCGDLLPLYIWYSVI